MGNQAKTIGESIRLWWSWNTQQHQLRITCPTVQHRGVHGTLGKYSIFAKKPEPSGSYMKHILSLETKKRFRTFLRIELQIWAGWDLMNSQ